MNLITTIFWLLFAHFLADYPLQTPEMGKYKNKKNQPELPDKDAKRVSVWFAYLTSHAFVHAGLSALVIGVPGGILIGLFHWIQDYLKCKIQYSPNLDQAIHIFIIVLIALKYCQ
jgi:ABC-type nitrate/sulfonate/bicarbonate transport system permease component